MSVNQVIFIHPGVGSAASINISERIEMRRNVWICIHSFQTQKTILVQTVKILEKKVEQLLFVNDSFPCKGNTPVEYSLFQRGNRL